MTKIKFCGLTRACDIAWANELDVDYIGFVFAPKSRRYITPEKAKRLKGMLSRHIKAVGVFVDESPESVAALLNDGVIDIAQLHGSEDESYIKTLREMTDKKIIQAFRINGRDDVGRASQSSADMILLDAGSGGSGRSFDWNLAKTINRDYILAGGLSPDNIRLALSVLSPFGVDVSSGIETDGVKDPAKMKVFVSEVRH